MNISIILTLTLRHLTLYIRNKIRLVELVFWPTTSLMIWGFLSVFLQKQGNFEIPFFIKFLIGAVIFWDIVFRSQQAITLSFLEDRSSRNLLNIFAAPVSIVNYVSACFLLGIIRVVIIIFLLASLAQVLYAFNLFAFEWNLIPFFINLLFFGWSLGMISNSLIMHFGKAAENLSWGLPFIIQPFVTVFYPLDTLPQWAQNIAQVLPATYIFEGIREVSIEGGIPWKNLMIATGGNIVLLILSILLFLYTFNVARKKGLLTKTSTQ